MNKSRLHPRFVSVWDGCHVWVQWDPTAAPYKVLIAFDEGKEMVALEGHPHAWASIPTWKDGSEIVVHVVDANGVREQATPAKFSTPKAPFRISNSSPIEFSAPAGSIFNAIVDGAAAAFQCREEVVVPSGQAVEVELVALQSVGWNQLDHPEHFRMSPAGGVEVVNLSPTEMDLEDSDIRRIVARADIPCMTLAFTRRDQF